MPYVDTITDELGKSMNIVSVRYTVGTNGVNDPDDIQLIKALFHCVPILYKKTNFRRKAIGNVGWNINPSTLPLPYDGTVWGIPELIKSFQKFANEVLSKYGYKVNVSGRIKPSGSFALVGKNYSTIAALNLFANLGTPEGTNCIEKIAADYRGTFQYLVEDDEESGD